MTQFVRIKITVEGKNEDIDLFIDEFKIVEGLLFSKMLIPHTIERYHKSYKIFYEEIPENCHNILGFLKEFSKTIPDSMITCWVNDEAPYNFSYEFQINSGKCIEICHNEELFEELRKLGDSERIV